MQTNRTHAVPTRTGGALFAVAVLTTSLLAGCSDAPATPESQAPATSVTGQELLEKHGVSIPAATINLGSQPWPDNAVMLIAEESGFYGDVGLSLAEPGLFVAQDQYVGLLLNGEVDVTAEYGPHLIRNAEGAGGEINMMGIFDATSGIAILAPPGTNYVTLKDALAKSGNFEQAVADVMAQLKGRSFSTDAVGAHRGFVDTVFDLGGISTDDLSELFAVDDREAVLMANGGNVDFVKPEGGAQTAALLQKGWYPLISLTDLIDNLPKGDPRAVAGLGHVGLSTTRKFFSENHDTVLRLASVQFRVIDAVVQDVESGDFSHIDKMIPALEAAASIDTSAEELGIIFTQISPFWPFEEQAAMWVDQSSPWYYETIYNVQIQAARDAGVIQSPDLQASDLFIAPTIYAELAQHKAEYDSLLAQAAGLAGEGAELAKLAAQQYDARNYLDAARILAAAVKA